MLCDLVRVREEGKVTCTRNDADLKTLDVLARLHGHNRILIAPLDQFERTQESENNVKARSRIESITHHCLDFGAKRVDNILQKGRAIIEWCALNRRGKRKGKAWVEF